MDLIITAQPNSGMPSPSLTTSSNATTVEENNRLVKIAQSVSDSEINNAHYIGLEVDLDKNFQSKLLNQIETIKGHEIGILEKTISSTRGEKRHLTLFSPKESKIIEQLKKHPEVLRDELVKLGQNLERGCLKFGGVGTLSFKEKVAYFLIPDESTAEQIQNFRRNVKNALERRTSTQLELETYFPHITLGFIKGDVHPVIAKGESKKLDSSLTAQLNVKGLDFSALIVPVSALELPPTKQASS